MIDIRIICTHDAVKTAQTLARVLAAEGRNVDVSYGRASLAIFEDVRAKPEAIILIWSLDAQSAHYMRHWQMHADPARLIEISRGPGYPDMEKRKAPVIDFGAWNGERGGAAWRALRERLRAVGRPYEPPRPAPKQAAIALGAVSALAVAGALIVRVQEALQGPMTPAPQSDRIDLADAAPMDGLGGPLQSLEPASLDDGSVRIGPLMQAELVEAPRLATPASIPTLAPDIEAREPQLLRRLEAIAEPLLGRDR